MSSSTHPALVKRCIWLAAALGALAALVLLSPFGARSRGASAAQPASAPHVLASSSHRRHAPHAARAHRAGARDEPRSSCWNPAADPATCTVTPSERPPVTTLTAADGARLARTASIVVPVRVSGPGTISAIGDAASGPETISVAATAPDGSTVHARAPEHFERVTEPASAVATHAGIVQLTVSLTDAAKARFAAGKPLEMFLTLRSSGSPATTSTIVSLKAR